MGDAISTCALLLAKVWNYLVVLMDCKAIACSFPATWAKALDSADAVYNRINASIDKYIEEHSIDAPIGERYEPVWTPEQERSELDLQAQGIISIIWCIGVTPGLHLGRGPSV
jgi:hypothetical protein